MNKDEDKDRKRFANKQPYPAHLESVLCFQNIQNQHSQICIAIVLITSTEYAKKNILLKFVRSVMNII